MPRVPRWSPFLLVFCASLATADPLDDALALLRPIQLPGESVTPFALDCRFCLSPDFQASHVRISYEGPDRYSLAAFAPNGVPVIVATEEGAAYVDHESKLRLLPRKGYDALLQLVATEGSFTFVFSYKLNLRNSADGLRVLIDVTELRHSVGRVNVLSSPRGHLRLFGRSQATDIPIVVALNPRVTTPIQRIAIGVNEPRCRLVFAYGPEAAKSARASIPVDAIRKRWPPLIWPADKKDRENAQVAFLTKTFAVGLGLLMPHSRRRVEAQTGHAPDWPTVERRHDKARKTFADVLVLLPDPHDRQRALAAFDAGNLQEALALVEPLARVGNIEALRQMALMVPSERGNAELALAWLRKAAQAETPLAQASLGAALSRGKHPRTDEVVRADPQEALFWLRCAATHGNLAAFAVVGILYATSDAVGKDPVEAYAWLLIAASGGDQKSIRARSVLEKRLDENQKKAAQRRANELREEYGQQ